MCRRRITTQRRCQRMLSMYLKTFLSSDLFYLTLNQFYQRHSGARIDFTQHLMNSIIQFHIIHPICQMSSVFSVEMWSLPYDRTAAVSEDAQDLPQDIPVLGLILPNI